MWDVDGVLVNNEHWHRLKHVRTLAAHGITDLDVERAHKEPQVFLMPDKTGTLIELTTPLHGTSDRHVYWWALSKHPELAQTLSEAGWREEELTAYETMGQRSEIQERHGVSQVIQNLADLNTPELIVIQGIVTAGAPRQLAVNRRVVKNSQLLDFEINAASIINGIQGKSYDSGRYLALDILRRRSITNVQHVIFAAVEDSPSGVRVALAAKYVQCIQWVIQNEQPYNPQPSSNQLRHALYSVAELETRLTEIRLEGLATVSLPDIAA